MGIIFQRLKAPLTGYYGTVSINIDIHRQFGRADLLVSQTAAQQRRPTRTMCQCYFDSPYPELDYDLIANPV